MRKHLIGMVLLLVVLSTSAYAYTFYGSQPSWWNGSAAPGLWVAAEWGAQGGSDLGWNGDGVGGPNDGSPGVPGWALGFGMEPDAYQAQGGWPSGYPKLTTQDPISYPWQWSESGLAVKTDGSNGPQWINYDGSAVPGYNPSTDGYLNPDGSGLPRPRGMYVRQNTGATTFDITLGNGHLGNSWSKRWYVEFTLDRIVSNAPYTFNLDSLLYFEPHATALYASGHNDYQLPPASHGLTDGGRTWWAEYYMPIQPDWENFVWTFHTDSSKNLDAFYVTHVLMLTSCTPEPSSFALMALACCLPVGIAYRRRKNKS